MSTKLTKSNAHQVLVEWNRTSNAYPNDRPVHELFEAQVQNAPQAVALVCGSNALTYEQLNRRANRVAHYLVKQGVVQESIVGLCVERSPDLIIGILGILKSGGAYLPLDPQYPSSRLRFMLTDAAPSVVLTHASLSAPIQHHEGQTVYLDSDREAIDVESDADPITKAAHDSLAYVIYTSGSTGEPKGVMLEHHGLCNVSAEQIRRFGVGPGSRVLQFSSMNFDASVFDIVMALTSGATLVVASRDAIQPGPPLAKLLREQAITILTIPPSSLNVLPQVELPDLTILSVAGEPCSAQLVARWAEGRRVFNLYGPTECTIWTTIEQCATDGHTPPIGRPIGNAQVYVLDQHGTPVDIGESGELYIGGAGVGRGYLNRAHLTSERFLDDGFCSQAGTRLYRTGDLVRYRPDGNSSSSVASMIK